MNSQSDVSILTDIKKSLSGIEEDNTDFDQDVLLQINAAFSVLNQLGIGPPNGFLVNDSTTTWNNFTTDLIIQGLVRQFILVSVKLGFDPPTSSFVLSSLQEQRKELQFRLTVEHDRVVNEEQ